MSSDIPEPSDEIVPEEQLHDSSTSSEPDEIEQNLTALAAEQLRILNNGGCEQQRQDETKLEHILERRNVMELCPELWAYVGNIYGQNEIPSDVFEAFYDGTPGVKFELLGDEMLSDKSGFIDEWQPGSERLRQRLDEVARDASKGRYGYMPSGEEYLHFMHQQHEFGGQFRTFGLVGDKGFDSIIAVVVPPTDEEAAASENVSTEQCGEFVTDVFGGGHDRYKWTAPDRSTFEFDRTKHDEAANFAQWYILGGRNAKQRSDNPHPYSTIALWHHVLQILKQEGRDIRHWYALSYHHLDLEEPPRSRNIAEAKNPVIERLLKKQLGFSEAGTVRIIGEVAGRDLGDKGMQIVKPLWTMLYGSAEHIENRASTIIDRLSGRGGGHNTAQQTA